MRIAIYYCLLSLFIFLINDIKAQDFIDEEGYVSGLLYVRINNPSYKPIGDENLTFETVELQELVDSYDIDAISKTVPSLSLKNNRSATEDNLFNTYTIHCNCNADELLTTIKENFSEYIVFAERVPVYYPMNLPDDYSLISSIENCGNELLNYHLDLINASEAWEVTTGNPDIRTAVIDYGFFLEHEDFFNVSNEAQHVNVYQENVTDDTHGTEVAGVIAASTNNGIGISAIGYNTKMDFHFIPKDQVNQSVIDHMFIALDNEVKVINYSSAGFNYSSVMEDAINAVTDAGLIVVASAGNGNQHYNCFEPSGTGICDASVYMYPASLDNVISVSGSGQNDNFEETIYRNNCTISEAVLQYNDKVDLTAPAYNIFTLRGSAEAFNPNGELYHTVNGSSSSAPMVSGTIALMLSVNPNLSPNEIKTILKCSADDIYHLNDNKYFGLFGAGRLNAGRAVELASLYQPLTADIVIRDACSADEGAIEIQMAGGLGSYSYSWSHSPVNSNNVTGLFQGEYHVRVTDEFECFFYEETIIIENQVDESLLDYPEGIVISKSNDNITDLNGDGRIIVRGPVVLQQDVNYTINNKIIEFVKHPEIEMQTNPSLPSSGIVVQEGATLKVNGSVLKGLNDCDAMWHGISVWGDVPLTVQQGGDKDVKIPISRKPKNGKLEITNSTIREAYIGVSLYRNPMPFVAVQKEHGRGVIEAENVNFINNGIGVDFRGFSIVENLSKLTSCSFIQNAPLLDESYFHNGEMQSFIRLRNVRNPEITANTFRGYDAFAMNKRGTGISSYDAAYSVVSKSGGPFEGSIRNVFTNLSKGIDIYATGGATSIKIKDNRFNNVYQGITANGSNFDEISFNDFNVPLGDENFNSWAMFMQTSAGFLATENTFTATQANEYTFGTVARNVTNVNGEFYRNVFEGAFSVATQAEGVGNNRLTLDCNRYNSSNTYDWAILSDNMADQGECGEVIELAATNLFSECTTADESQIWSLTEFDYSSISEFTPNCVSENVFIEECQDITESNFNNLCPQLVESPCVVCGFMGNDPFGFITLPVGPIREKLKGMYYRELAQSGNIDQLVAIMTEGALPEDRKILIPTLWQRERYADARKELNELPTETETDVDFHRLFDVLVGMGETERRLHEMNPSEEQVIRSVAAAENETRVLAEAVLAQLSKETYIRFPEQLPINVKSWVNDDEDKTKSKKENIKVYPNPSDRNVTVEFEKAKKVNAQLYDGMGRLVRTFETNGEENQYKIRGLSHGIYNLRMIDSNGNIETKRIIIR